MTLTKGDLEGFLPDDEIEAMGDEELEDLEAMLDVVEAESDGE